MKSELITNLSALPTEPEFPLARMHIDGDLVVVFISADQGYRIYCGNPHSHLLTLEEWTDYREPIWIPFKGEIKLTFP